jgi:hypothetical protein
MIAGTHESGPFTEAEKAVLAYADQMVLTNMNGDMSPALFTRLRAHFSEPEILELGVVMAIVAGMAKLSFLLSLVEKEGTAPSSRKAPPPRGLSPFPVEAPSAGSPPDGNGDCPRPRAIRLCLARGRDPAGPHLSLARQELTSSL